MTAHGTEIDTRKEYKTNIKRTRVYGYASITCVCLTKEGEGRFENYLNILRHHKDAFRHIHYSTTKFIIECNFFYKIFVLLEIIIEHSLIVLLCRSCPTYRHICL